MVRRKTVVIILVSVMTVIFFCSIALAETLTIGAGAGYKRMFEEVLTVYQSKTGQRVDQVYGHMGQVVTQAKSTGSMGIVIGELSFLKTSGLVFSDYRAIGQGVLVLAYGKHVTLSDAEALNAPNIQKIAMPDAKQAIYGKAALEFLNNTGLYEKIKEKMVTVATVPQVASYLISKDAEAGFINITDAIYIRDKIGGWVEIDQTQYHPIQLAMGVVKGFESKPEVKRFVDFMFTDGDAKSILQKAGIH